MIHLFTGIPGIGKTSYVVAQLAAIKDRPIFVMGIPDLKIPHQPCPPVSEWTEVRPSPEDATLFQAHFVFPPNSIIVIDEAQTVYRPRAASSKVPPHVAAFETHRHTGVDFWLITQSPKLIDSNIRELISRHVHFRATPFGRKMHEWAEMGDPDSVQSRSISRTTNYKPPKAAFSLYKSAEAHTKVKVGIPIYYYVFFASLVALVAIGYYAYSRVAAYQKPSEAGQLPTGAPSKGGVPAPRAIQVAYDYSEKYSPRLAGLPHTAPAYDKLTEPQAIPEPVGCVATETKCKCITQQGTTYQTTDAICRQLVKSMFFRPWKPDNKPEIVQPVAKAPPAPALPLQAAVPSLPANPDLRD